MTEVTIGIPDGLVDDIKEFIDKCFGGETEPEEKAEEKTAPEEEEVEEEDPADEEEIFLSEYLGMAYAMNHLGEDTCKELIEIRMLSDAIRIIAKKCHLLLPAAIVDRYNQLVKKQFDPAPLDADEILAKAKKYTNKEYKKLVEQFS